MFIWEEWPPLFAVRSLRAPGERRAMDVRHRLVLAALVRAPELAVQATGPVAHHARAACTVTRHSCRFRAMTRPRRDPHVDWRTRGVTLVRAEVAAILVISSNRVEEMVLPRSRKTPRRCRWSPDDVAAIADGRELPSRDGAFAFLRCHPHELTTEQVAAILRCQPTTVPWLDIPSYQVMGAAKYSRWALEDWLRAEG